MLGLIGWFTATPREELDAVESHDGRDGNPGVC
jgi:hypothetical protein